MSVAAPDRDAGSAQLDAMVDAVVEGSGHAPSDASIADAGDAAAKQRRRHADESEHVATAGRSSTKHAAHSSSDREGAGAGGAAASAAAGQSGGSAGVAAPEVDPRSFAAELSGLFIDMPCDPATPTPLPEGMACSHAPNTQSFEKAVTFGGHAGTHYTLTLRVRAIWEPTEITGGEDPYAGVPFTIGGSVPTNPDGTPTNAINYQQFQIQVAEPAQTYYLNNYHAAAHEIHQEDYEASLEVAGGSVLKLVVHDGNDLEIGNFRQLMFSDFPPYDNMPSLGQSVRLDVVKVEVRP